MANFKRIVISKKRSPKNGSAAFITNHKNEILLVKRRDVPMWVLPAGAKEGNESLKNTAIRETLEETGLKVKITRKVAIYERKPKTFQTHLFEGHTQSGKTKETSESKEVKFFKPMSLPTLTDPQTKIMIKDALKKNSKTIKGIFPKRSSLVSPFFPLRHPLVTLRYLLLTQGIHINT